MGAGFLRLLVAASLALALLPLGFARQYAADWNATRRGKSLEDQRLSLRGVTWFKPAFVDFVDRLRRTLPADAKLLVEPGAIEDGSGAARWFLFLNHYLRPCEIYVREPALACGCLPDYPLWLAHHADTPTHTPGERAALEERGIEWRLVYPANKKFVAERLLLYRRSGAGWDLVDLAPSSGILERAQREPQGGAGDNAHASEGGF